MAGLLRVPRSRGAVNGMLLVLLGIWGGIIPFVGPYFGYGYTPTTTWTYTTGRLYLDILPAAATVLGGLVVLASGSRPVAIAGAWLAAVSGAWFVIGRSVSTLWTLGGVSAAGAPTGGTLTRAVEQIGIFTGLGVVIVFFAAVALGRFTVRGVADRRGEQPVLPPATPRTSAQPYPARPAGTGVGAADTLAGGTSSTTPLSDAAPRSGGQTPGAVPDDTIADHRQ